MKNKFFLWMIPLLLIGTGIFAITGITRGWPCHPAGDIVPCIHRTHQAGDLIPCTHYCTNAVGLTVACHPAGDIVPCIHPSHLAGDIIPCTHICY